MTGILESNVDVLIIGAGPAGLMMATWMAKCGINARIVDKRGTKIFNGQADGLQCRTLEILDSLGFGHRAWREANHMLEICLWNPDENGTIKRSDRIADTIPGISRFQQVVLHQGRIERFFLDAIAEASDICVERGVMPSSLKIDESLVDEDAAYPITVTLKHLTEEEATPKQSSTSVNGQAIQDGLFRSNLAKDDTQDLLDASKPCAKANNEEVVHAKYLIGADGAHSWTRNQIGLRLEGDSTDYIWGVLDIVPITDFPDIRMRCAIHSANYGSVMVIPRENKLVRLYIQLTTTEKTGDDSARADRSKIHPQIILESAQRILAPYKITYRKLDWWTAYQIGQRVGTSFSVHERVFLVGDAVHTHSPKAGQGMNVSMQDSFNLGWKIASVVKGYTRRSILKTYQSERRRIAQDLIAFDRKFSRLFSGRPAKDVMDAEGISMEEFKLAFEKGNMFASGIAVNYGASTIVAKEGSSAEQGDGTDVSVADSKHHVISDQSLCGGITVGMRIPSHKILSQADARPWHLHEVLPSNGRWRVVIFAGNTNDKQQRAKLWKLSEAFDDRNSFLGLYTPKGARYDELFEVLLIHNAPRISATVLDFPEIFRPFDEVYGWDYNKIFVDDVSYHEGFGNIYETLAVSQEGCIVIVRPDQYVSYIGPMGDTAAVNTFFAGFMKGQ
ncbi:phenol 2-monooxygenase [Trichoderma arundinaceum]|uniref:Phenol 2-monooxygenase n=1 Tax=Trichoderma arundinaceum TaxID=490622 RepID=A0A395NUC3_TRIAR|nr:phenol 2-monooxygenase [Trichoderma arundinaceum]